MGPRLLPFGQLQKLVLFKVGGCPPQTWCPLVTIAGASSAAATPIRLDARLVGGNAERKSACLPHICCLYGKQVNPGFFMISVEAYFKTSAY